MSFLATSLTRLKPFIKRFVDTKTFGSIEYFMRSRIRSVFGPLNGQKLRMQLFADLMKNIRFSAIVETGTFRGETAEYLSRSTGLPVYTVESNPRFFGFSRMRFLSRPNVRSYQGDSVEFLSKLAEDPALQGRTIFFYLDAHWYDRLPLAEEIETIFRSWDKAVILIDDFQVPFDPGYGYDDYGPGKVLALPLLEAIRSVQFGIFFPATASQHETGHKRGCAVLAKDPEIVGTLNGLKGLVRYGERPPRP